MSKNQTPEHIYEPLGLKDLRGKIIIVTGAAGGIGSVIMLKLLAEGARAVGIDTKPFLGSELEERVSDVYQVDRDFSCHQGNAASPKAMRPIINSLVEIHGLVNFAGLLGADNEIGGSTLTVFDRMMEAHTKTTFTMTRLAVKKMLRGASVVSAGSVETDRPAAHVGAYAAAQGAKRALTRADAVTYGPQGIRVNMISPGYVQTAANLRRYAGMSDGGVEELEGLERLTLLNFVPPEDVANWVLWLLSSSSGNMTGQEFVLDGGASVPLVGQKKP